MPSRTTITRTALLPILAILATLSLSACNTIKGVGKDTEAVGEKIQEEAEDQQNDSPYKKNMP